MADSITLKELQAARGSKVIDSAGDQVGELEDIYYDYDTGAPEWIGVKSGMINKTKHLIPLDGAHREDGGVQVAFPKERIDNSPEIDATEISPETEDEIYRAYGIQRTTFGGEQSAMPSDAAVGDRESGHAPGEPRASHERTSDDAASMTLHEEQVNIGKRSVPAGTARLRKWVETDTVEQDVALRHEHAEVRRESIDEPAPGAELREETAEMELTREEPVVEKETRATERVSLDRETDVEHQDVQARVGRERAEVEGVEDERSGFGR